MNKKVKSFIFAIFCILLVQFIFIQVGYAEDWSGAGSSASLAPDSAGLFDNKILTEMHRFMLNTYRALGQVMMIGHALMCYAVHVDYTNVLDIVHLPNLNFFLVGLIIYAIGVFMAMSAGMYFVDVCFKLGFALLFMPVSIALWPFPPTKRKFADNLSIIIRNSMLFMLVAIGVSYSVKLISEGLISDGDNFWNAVAQEETELLSKSFSFFSSHILVVIFCLAYGLKILEGSVNNYLNAFFFDSLFGSESPMHKMGTQALGTLKGYTVDPAVSWAKDVASHQTGKAISAAGGGIASLGSGISKLTTREGREDLRNQASAGIRRVKNFRNNAVNTVKQTADAIANPRETYNNAMSAAAQKVNNGIVKGGNVLKSAVDSVADNVLAFAPIPMRESWRQALLNGTDIDGKHVNGLNDYLNDYIDKKANKIGNKAEQVIAHGGGAMKEAAKQGVAATGAAIHNMRDDGSNQITTADMRKKLHQKHEAVNQVISSVPENIEKHGKRAATMTATAVYNATHADAEQKTVAQMRRDLHNVHQAVDNVMNNKTEALKQVAAFVEQKGQNLGKADNEKISRDEAREILHQDAETIKNGAAKIKSAATGAAQGVKKAAGFLNDQANQAPISLAPSKIISAPFKAMKEPQKTMKNIANNYDKLKQADGKIILKKAGQIVVRTVKDTGKDAVNATGKTVGLFGKMLQNFGNDMADNSKHKSKRQSIRDAWEELNKAEKERQEAMAAEAENNRSMDVGD